MALVTGLLILPMAGLSLLAFEAINHHQVDLRLGRAGIASAVLGAKQDFGRPSNLTDAHRALLQAVLRLNMQSVLPDATQRATVTSSPTLDPAAGAWLDLGANHPYSVIYAPLLQAAITSDPASTSISAAGLLRAERRRIPTEYVFVLDASSSMRGTQLAKIRGGLRRFLDATMGRDGANPDNDPDVWVSVVEFSENVNVGARYADELVTLQSRRIPNARSKRQAGRLVARAFGYRDYLHKDGPEGARGGACVARKSNTGRTSLVPMSSGGGLSPRYASLLETPPSSNADRFDLLIAEGNYSGTNPGLGGYGRYIGAMCTDFERHPGEAGFPAYTPKDAEQVNTSAGKTVLRIQYLPWNRRPGCVRSKLRRYSARWSRTVMWPPIQKDLAVSAYPGCAQPMLIASNSRQELRAHIDGYKGVLTTAADEGFAWGYRALHPDWRDIWHSDSSRTISPGVPADFGAGVKKKFILFSDGFNNQRFFAPGQGDERNVSRFCRYLTGESRSSPRVPGEIEIAVALTGAQLPDTERYLRDDCASLPVTRNFLATSDVDDIADFLEGLAEVVYEVRLVPRPAS